MGSQRKCCEAYCSRDDDVARLAEIVLEDVDDNCDQNNNDKIRHTTMAYTNTTITTTMTTIYINNTTTIQ